MHQQQSAVQIARQLAAHQEQLKEEARRFLSTISRVMSGKGNESTKCNGFLMEMLRLYPMYSNIGVIDSEGNIVCSALPGNKPSVSGGPECFQRVITTPDFTLHFQPGLSQGCGIEPSFTYPLTDQSGSLRAVVFASLSPHWIERIASDLDLPANTAIQIVSREGQILARYPKSESVVEQVWPKALLARMDEAQNRESFKGDNENNVPFFYSSAKLGNIPEKMYVIFGIPEETIRSKALPPYFRELGWLILGLMLLLTIILAGGEILFCRPMRTLVNTTSRLSAGDFEVRTGLKHGGGEIGLLAKSFDDMANTLQKHSIESEQLEEVLRESGSRLRGIFDQAFQFIGLLESNGVVVEFNQTALYFAGLKNAHVYGKPIWDTHWWAFSSEAQQNLYEAVTKAAEGQLVRYETKMQGVGGQIACVILSLKPIKNELGHVVHLIFEGFDITERKAAEEALERSEKQLRHLSTQLIKAQEYERKRIAQELHDSIGQSLSAIKFSVESALNWIGAEDTCRTHPALKSLQAVVPMVQQTVEETRRIMTDLRPSILDDLGIVATLGWFVREFQKVYPNTHVEKQLEVDDAEVPEALKIVIYRIVQESFHNISKYSNAEYVELTLSKSPQGIELFIEDNGIGFDLGEAMAMKTPKSGLGITSMRERTELSGGTFTIRSIKGEGTTIQAQWPV